MKITFLHIYIMLFIILLIEGEYYWLTGNYLMGIILIPFGFFGTLYMWNLLEYGREMERKK